MPRRKRPQARPLTNTEARELTERDIVAEDGSTLELREEQLVASKELREAGKIRIRTEIEHVQGQIEVEAYHEEVVVEHEPVGLVVSKRDEPWQEDDTLIVPVYEEQLVVTRRLVLRERIRIRHLGTTERQIFQDTLRRERLVVEDPSNTGLVREHTVDDQVADADGAPQSTEDAESPGFLQNLVRKALE